MKAVESNLGKILFRLNGVKRVFLAQDFLTVTKEEDIDWEALKPDIFSTLLEFYASGQPVLNEDATISQDTLINEDDTEDVVMIKELIETRVRPAVQDDGGDITYLGFVDGVVFLQMQGSCSGCPSSSYTLKVGIERMLMHWVSGVNGVMAVDSYEEFVKLAGDPVVSESEKALRKLESKLSAKEKAEKALNEEL
eukprot:TRINITY_DN3808_c0_g2_i1.p1 TRINITY_DN3808_c0_g2~~TRINITY_DN3808_c0_g2_i1.p1  ORF type:complete len:195 (+),score=60.97 TRINITY_DN3808_c0_g2_i1:94-678(+)